MNPALTRLVDALSPGATPVSLRRLKGGLGARMHVLRYETQTGERRTVVLRRSVRHWDEDSPEKARYAFDVLRLLQKAGIPAPRPLLLDAAGQFFDCPAMVLSYVPGRSFFEHPDEGAWVDGLARALADVHTITPRHYDLSWLEASKLYPDRVDRDRERIAGSGPLAQRVHETLLAHANDIEPKGPTLMHDDYWPGNTVWYRGHLAAVVDWSSAKLGDPRCDVAQCRTDLVFSNSIATADAFLERYQVATAGYVRDLWYFDLFMGMRALLNYSRWLEGYHDAGMRHLALTEVGARIEAFVQHALAKASQVRDL